MDFAAGGASLGRIRWVNLCKYLTSFFRFVRYELHKLRPGGIRHALPDPLEGFFLELLNINAFARNYVETFNEVPRKFMVEVGALVAHLAVKVSRRTPLLLALRLGELLLGRLEKLGVLDLLPIGKCDDIGTSKVEANGAEVVPNAGDGFFLDLCVDRNPPVARGVLAHGVPFGFPDDGAVLLEFHPPKFIGEFNFLASGFASKPWVGEAIVPPLPLEAGKPWLLSALDAVKKAFVGFMDPAGNVVEHCDAAILHPREFFFAPLANLLVGVKFRNIFSSFFIFCLTPPKNFIVCTPTNIEVSVHRSLLRAGRVKPIFVGFNHVGSNLTTQKNHERE